MSLPALIEIAPPPRPVTAAVTVPGSKSITNRALVLAALGRGQTVLRGALWSEDTQVMTEALLTLGFKVTVEPDPNEVCNRTITVQGLGGRIPQAGAPSQPLDIFVGNAGTAARFLAAMLCLGQGTYRLHGVPRMHQRPQAALFQALRHLGYRVEATDDKLPAVITGAGPRRGRCRVSIQDSSQFASALLLAAKTGGWSVEIEGENADESPYVAMTSKLVEAFPQNGGVFPIEPDASSGSYFWAASALLPLLERPQPADVPLNQRVFEAGGTVTGWPKSDWQIDAAFPRFLKLPRTISRQRDLGDSILTAMILAPFASYPVRFTELGRLRVQECERVAAMRDELTRCGAIVEESGDTLTVQPSAKMLHGADIETYNDHRIAMCFGTLGLRIPGIRIKNPACVKKTFPNFFQKLAAAPPQGLGVTIRNAADGKVLAGEELFAG